MMEEDSRRKSGLLRKILAAFCLALTMFAVTQVSVSAAKKVTLVGKAQKEAPVVESYDSKEEAQTEAKNGLVSINGKYYYLKNGKFLKKKWKTVSGARFYFGKGGKAVGGYKQTIKGKRYVFSKEGVLQNGKSTRIVNVDGTDRIIDRKGSPVEGWTIYKNKLYYSTKWGEVKKNKTVDDVRLGAGGAAKSGTGTSLKITCIRILNRITRPGMSSSEKIRRIWNYVCTFRYAGKYPESYSKNSFRKLAYNMLTTHSGNCYGYACAFAALCKQAGCSAKVVYGLCRGSRDHRADGMTRHCWTYVNGGYYDPEGNAAGWCRGLYGWRSVSFSEHGRSDI